MNCRCRACNPDSWEFIVCEFCGNKRCPHATDHELACTGSNDVNQPGSVYGPKEQLSARYIASRNRVISPPKCSGDEA
jgi:hypothetical protein